MPLPLRVTTIVAENYIAAVAEFTASDFTTPLHARLHTVLMGRIFDVGRGARFRVESVNFDIKTRGNGNDAPVVLYNTEVVVRGEMTYSYGGSKLTDAGAYVTIGQNYTTMHTSAWDGTTFRDMPEGASRRVQQAVLDEVVKELPSQAYWKIVAQEAHRMIQHNNFHNELRKIENAVEKMNGILKQTVTFV